MPWPWSSKHLAAAGRSASAPPSSPTLPSSSESTPSSDDLTTSAPELSSPSSRPPSRPWLPLSASSRSSLSPSASAPLRRRSPHRRRVRCCSSSSSRTPSVASSPCPCCLCREGNQRGALLPLDRKTSAAPLDALTASLARAGLASCLIAPRPRPSKSLWPSLSTESGQGPWVRLPPAPHLCFPATGPIQFQPIMFFFLSGEFSVFP